MARAAETAGARLDAVLPLTAADAERAQILFRSLDRFFEPLATCWVVVPDRDAGAVAARLPRGRYVLVPESELIPELRWFRATARLRSKLRLVGPPLHGWFVQQLVKLAVAERVETPFYLTLDADVICVRRTRYEDLVREGRALMQTSPPNHPEWNDDAERVLGLPRSGRQYAVTPALLSREAVGALARHLEQRGGSGWRRHLLRSLPWTEYAVYGTFVERTGLLDRYHVLGGEDALYGNAVWLAAQFDDWDAAETFDETNEFCFSVVQSATRIPPERVAAEVAPYLNGARPTRARTAQRRSANEARLRQVRNLHRHEAPFCATCFLLEELDRARAHEQPSPQRRSDRP